MFLAMILSLLIGPAQAELSEVMFCSPVQGAQQPDFLWLETRVSGTGATYQGFIKASHRSFGILVDSINQIEWVFKDITVPTKSLENSPAYRLVFREAGWTLDEYSEEYKKTYLMDCHAKPAKFYSLEAGIDLRAAGL